MSERYSFRGLNRGLCAWAVLVLVGMAAGAGQAATVWTGPMISFTKPDLGDPNLPANQDRLTPDVWITRGNIQGLFNASDESGFSHFFSPAGTAWANGTTANYAALTYTDWNTWAKTVNGGPGNTVGLNAVVHLISSDIYLDIRFTSWSSGGGGGFSYLRSTPLVPEPASGLLLLVGFAGLGAVRRLRRRN
jgi:hypothetical protein